MSKSEKLIDKAVSALRSEDNAKVTSALTALNALTIDELTVELSIRIKNMTAGKDIDKLLSSATLPLPSNPKAITNTVTEGDTEALHALYKSDSLGLIAGMLVLVTALQEVSEPF